MDDALERVRRLAPGVADERVLHALAAVPRERFVAEPDRGRAYENVALPIACDQTISQPVVVARMLELLEVSPTDRVLDVGTGSGYHAALLGRLAGEVWTIERHSPLSAAADRVLRELGLDNVHCVVGDGWDGLPEHSPFDAVNVAAATGQDIPPALAEQLAVGGRLVAPVGSGQQRLTRVRRTAQGLEVERLDPVRFVPLVRGPTD